MTDFTRLRPHWRPTHQADPIGFDRWIGPDGANGWVKILNPDGHLCRQVWSVAPYARLCLRLHPMSEQQAELLSDPFGLGIAHADQWSRWLVAQGVDANRVACEGINEAALWNPGVIQAHNVYAGSFGKAMRERGLTAVIGNINTGWPGNTGPDTPVNWNPLLATLHAIRLYGHILGLHEYCDGRGPVPDWGWNMGRFTQLPREFAGLPILFTEVGYDRAVNAPSGTGNHGWAGELSIDTYMEYLTEYDRRLRAYPNALAAFIFTHDFDQPWGTWDTVPLLDRLCGHAEWVRTQAVPTTPETPATVPPTTIHLPVVAADGGGGPSSTPPTAAPTEPQPPAPPTWDDAPDSTWQRSIAFVLGQEGGLSTDPNDPGNYVNGKFIGTKYGISAAAHPGVDVVNLTIEQAKEIYRTQYWIASGANMMPWPMCLAHLDLAVNGGVGRAQQALTEAGHDFTRYMAWRLKWYCRIENFDRYGRAWIRRCADLMEEATRAA